VGQAHSQSGNFSALEEVHSKNVSTLRAVEEWTAAFDGEHTEPADLPWSARPRDTGKVDAVRALIEEHRRFWTGCTPWFCKQMHTPIIGRNPFPVIGCFGGRLEACGFNGHLAPFPGRPLKSQISSLAPFQSDDFILMSFCRESLAAKGIVNVSAQEVAVGRTSNDGRFLLGMPDL
jgi:hypothetical protein